MRDSTLVQPPAGEVRSCVILEELNFLRDTDVRKLHVQRQNLVSTIAPAHLLCGCGCAWNIQSPFIAVHVIYVNKTN